MEVATMETDGTAADTVGAMVCDTGLLSCRVAMLLNAALRALPKMATVNCLSIGDDFWLSYSIV